MVALQTMSFSYKKLYSKTVGNGFIRSEKGGMHKCIPYGYIRIISQTVEKVQHMLGFFDN